MHRSSVAEVLLAKPGTKNAVNVSAVIKRVSPVVSYHGTFSTYHVAVISDDQFFEREIYLEQDGKVVKAIIEDDVAKSIKEDSVGKTLTIGPLKYVRSRP